MCYKRNCCFTPQKDACHIISTKFTQQFYQDIGPFRKILPRSKGGEFLGEDFNVEYFVNSTKGLERLKAKEYGLFFVGLSMPINSKREIIQVSKEYWPNTKVVIITGYDREHSEVKAAFMAGADDIIYKPFSDIDAALLRLKKQWFG